MDRGFVSCTGMKFSTHIWLVVRKIANLIGLQPVDVVLWGGHADSCGQVGVGTRRRAVSAPKWQFTRYASSVPDMLCAKVALPLCLSVPQ